jgi:hypothetical protein
METQTGTFKREWRRRQRSLKKRGVDCSYLYAHLEADTGNIFYIGLGNTVGRPWSLDDRSKEHKDRIEKHGLKVEIITDSKHSGAMIAWWETWWIKACRAAGFDLVNISDGGAGAGVVRPQTRQKLREKNLNKKYSPEVNKKKGRKGPKIFTEEGYAKLCEPKSDDFCVLMSKIASEIQSTDEQKQKNREGVLRFLSSMPENYSSERSKKAWESMTPEKIQDRSEKCRQTRSRNKEIYGDDYHRKNFKGPRSKEFKQAVKKACWSRPTHWSNVLSFQDVYFIGTSTDTLANLGRKFNLTKGKIKDIKKYIAELIGVDVVYTFPKQKTVKIKLGPTKGASHHSAKISEKVAQEILDSQETIAVLKRRYNVSYDVVSYIKNRRTWKHLTPSENL